MTRKTTELYRSVLERVHDLVPEFHPRQVIADFEEAPTAAMRDVFGPEVTISGCWFYFAQTLLKQLKKIGLSDAYTNDEDTQVIFRCILALPLPPVADVCAGFSDIKSLVKDGSVWKTQLYQLRRYVERQCINKSNIGAARLSVRDNTSRTSNAVESFHAALRRRVQVAHPNLYTFLGHLQRTTTDIDNEIARLNRGLTIRRAKKRTNLIYDARIKACVSRYDRGVYTRIQFLRAVSHCVGMQDVSNDGQSSDTDDSDDDGRSASDQPPSAVVDPQAEMCEFALFSHVTANMRLCRVSTSASRRRASRR